MVSARSLLSLSPAGNLSELISEADYYQCWTGQLDESWTAEETAFAGGLIADRLAFLFVAGYQAAVRRTFGIKDKSWTALAVSEDRSPKSPKPGLVETNGRLDGFKTWVASSRFIEQLIVTAAGSDELYLVNRNTPGLTLHHKPSAPFLGDMSQGIAEFTRVPVTGVRQLGELDLKLFAKREPLYLYFAFCGFLHHKARHPGTAELLENLLTISRGDFTDPDHKQLFAATDTRVSEIFSELPQALFKGNFQQDKGLMSLYSRVIQKRAGLG